MSVPSSRDLALLKAFDAVLAEGRFLDETLGGLLDVALRFFDAVAVALQPAGGAPALSRAGSSLVATAAEQRLGRFLEALLAEGKERRLAESGLVYISAPVKSADQVRGAFGIAIPHSQSKGPEPDEGVRLFSQALTRVLDRERQVATLLKRREEAVALFELAAGALHTLNADEVLRLTAASLAKQLEFDQVQAFRYHPHAREVEHILGQGTSPGTAGYSLGERRPLDADELLSRALAAHGPVFDDEDGTDPGAAKRRRRLALTLEAGETVFGFLSMSRRGTFVLTPQEMRLVKELARLAAGALEKARLIDAERRTAERIAFLNRLHGALAGLSEPAAILERTAKEVGTHFDFDLCAIHLLPAGELPGASAFHWKSGLDGVPRTDEVPKSLLDSLPSEESYLLLPDVAAEAHGLSFVPAPEVLKDLPRPIGLLAVPLAYRGEVAGVLLAISGGRPRTFTNAMLRSFQEVATEVSLGVTSARSSWKERESYRFLDRLREVGRTLTTTFDGPRIKHALCEQAVALLKGDSAQFWDADPHTKSLRVLSHWGPDPGGEGPRLVQTDAVAHPVVRAFLEKALVLVSEGEARTLYPPAPGLSLPAGLKAVAVPLLYQEEPIGVLTLSLRSPTPDWPSELAGRLSLLADSGAVALHNARLMKIIEQQTERDGVTGLYNQAAVVKRLESELRRAERSGQPLAVAHVRIDGLTDAIQRFGASFGDSLLPKVAAHLVRATRSVNIVGRDRDDRFWILIFDANKSTGQRAVEAIQRNFAMAFDPRLDAAGLHLSLSVGLAAYPEDAFDTSSLLGRAEEALDDAIKAGAGSIALYGALASEESEAAL